MLSCFQVSLKRLELEILFLVSGEVMWMVIDGKGIEMLTYVVILLLYLTIKYRLKLKVRNFFVLILELCLFKYHEDSGGALTWDHSFNLNARFSAKLTFLTPLRHTQAIKYVHLL